MDGVPPFSSPSVSEPTPDSPSISHSLTIQDSLESSDTAAPLSLLAFMNLVGTKNNDLQEAIRISTDSTLISRIPFYLQSVSGSLEAIEVFDAFLVWSSQASLIIKDNNSDISTLSTALSSYNSNVPADLATVAAMNTAITNYKNGSIALADYNAAVATYNAYATAQAERVSSANAAITTFNTAAGVTNSNIDILNSDIPPDGEAFTHQATYAARPALSTISTAPPTPTGAISFSESTLTPLPTLTVTFATLAILQVQATVTFVSNIAQDAMLLQMLKNADKFFAYQIFYLTGIDFDLPAAFTTPANKISVTDPGTAGGAGSSINLSIAGSSLSSPDINDVLGHSIFISELERIYVSAFTSINQNTSADVVASTLNLTTASLVSQMGFLSLSTAVRLLGGQGALASIDPRSSLAALTVGIGLISEIAGAIYQGVFKSSVLSVLKKGNPSLPEEQLQSLSAKLSSSIEIKVLLLGILNLASTLNSRDLLGRLLGTVTVIESPKSELLSKESTKKIITKESIKGTPLDSLGVNALLDANNGSLTKVELSTKLEAEFKKSGLTDAKANFAALSLVSTLDKTYPQTNDQETSAGLAANLNAQIKQKIEGETTSSQAEKIAAELISTLFGGSNSVKSLLEGRIQAIKNSSDDEAAKMEEDFKKFVTPDSVTLGLAIILGDPAMSLLFMASGIIYTPDQSPSKPGSLNRQHLGSIDMPI